MMENDFPPISPVLIGPFPSEDEAEDLPEPVLPGGGVPEDSIRYVYSSCGGQHIWGAE